MKLKVIKNLKTDVSGYIGSSFKICKSLKDIKSNVYFKLNKNLKRKKIKKSVIFSLRNLLNKAKLKSASSYTNSTKNSKSLDFNSANTRNVFLRTKRKSSFGQTLLEKQRLKFFIPSINESYLKKYFDNTPVDNKGISGFSNENYKNIFSEIGYVLNSSNIFISKSFLKSKLVLKDSFFFNSLFGVYSFESNNIKYNFLKLFYTKEKQTNLKVFNRLVPNNILYDIRINKLRILSGFESTLPFNFNVKKVIQHYRLKRS